MTHEPNQPSFFPHDIAVDYALIAIGLAAGVTALLYLLFG